jgi:hypothetical protein
MSVETITENGIQYLQSNPLNQITVNGVDYELNLKINLTNFTVGSDVDMVSATEALQTYEALIANDIIRESYYYPIDELPEGQRTIENKYRDMYGYLKDIT